MTGRTAKDLVAGPLGCACGREEEEEEEEREEESLREALFAIENARAN